MSPSWFLYQEGASESKLKSLGGVILTKSEKFVSDEIIIH